MPQFECLLLDINRLTLPKLPSDGASIFGVPTNKTSYNKKPSRIDFGTAFLNKTDYFFQFSIIVAIA
ncbi:hypothetical protein CLV99_1911 [Sphingobacterium yanglingense]|uniref:Uncharacterized protein n=1 Tax=Sphingobacterium yanglingense TaxID=1437280 RepID=A0A4R6WDT6_9SPHI|nr:hypothetical protein CLV99_1911 [Sphingobacterium yanglingense]